MQYFLDSSKIIVTGKAKVFLSDYTDMCYTHVSGFSADLTCCLFHVSETFYALDLTMEVAQIRVEDGTFQVYCQYIAQYTEVWS